VELKWLEDFISLARTRSFSRSAEERHVTQSAFSRRIRALEVWLGVSLVDRSTYPTTLTPEGRQFRETAEEAVRMFQVARFELQSSRQQSRHIVSIAALHTLSLTFFPRWFRKIEEKTGAIGSRLLPDSFHNCLQAVVEGGYDFLFTFHHPSIQIPLDPDLFPYLVVGHDRLVAVAAMTLTSSESTADTPLPLLRYAEGSFLGRLAVLAQGQEGTITAQVAHTNENAMAEALKFMALEGHGVAWLPCSLVAAEIEAGTLAIVGPDFPMEIRLYRSAERTRKAVEQVWAAAKSLAE
jgi:LysR family transcriptional regulator, hypochlorite-specific transcription factor HypT